MILVRVLDGLPPRDEQLHSEQRSWCDLLGQPSSTSKTRASSLSHAAWLERFRYVKNEFSAGRARVGKRSPLAAALKVKRTGFRSTIVTRPIVFRQGGPRQCWAACDSTGRIYRHDVKAVAEIHERLPRSDDHEVRSPGVGNSFVRHSIASLQYQQTADVLNVNLTYIRIHGTRKDTF
jgi:hypothetical protein